MEPVDIILQSIKNNVRQVKVLSHNVANVNTPGYQSKQAFALYQQDGSAQVMQRVTPASHALQQTGRSLDVGIVNDAYLAVEQNGQTLVTKYGRLYIDADSQLRHASGAFVLGESGHVNLPEGQVSIDATGTLFVNGEQVDELLTVSPSAPDDMHAVGSGLYQSRSRLLPALAELQQGAINAAAVNASGDMVRLIELSRHTQSLQKAVLAMDQISNAAINELGKR